MKICSIPQIADLGLGRVVDAYRKHMPKYGIEYTDDVHAADLLVCHAGSYSKDRQTDVHHCHGLYPTAVDVRKSYFDMNADVIENVRQALTVTTPSDWVAQLFRRDMLIEPVVMGHGIDVKEWFVFADGYDRNDTVLWAKGTDAGVSNPAVVSMLANMLPERNFVSTFVNSGGLSNVRKIGVQRYDAMCKVLATSGVYLATTKETFGIQTLEALACGVPVVGYRWGATPDIVTHGLDGYLAAPGDLDDLANGIEWVFANMEQLSANAKEAVVKYDWDIVCGHMADLYVDTLLRKGYQHDIDVSVIIPCYNYADLVGGAIESVMAQDYTGSYEIIVVNDGSTDDSDKAIQKYSEHVVYIKQENSGVAEARNCGVRQAVGEFVTCLDADDRMKPNFVSTLAPVLKADRGLGIAYGSLENFYPDSDGKLKNRVGDWPPKFCYKRQMIGQNQVPSACMYRKEAWQRAGGYRGKYSPAEDADLWLMITTLGYGAVKVTDDPLYLYSVHGGSLSRTLPNVKYEDDKPWPKNIDNVPFGAVACEYGKDSFPVRDYDDPWVSVIIPVGPGHESIVCKAIDSVWLQSIPYWEIIVVNDSGGELWQPSTGRLLQEAYPYIKLIECNVGNVSTARNMGVDAASGDMLTFLDADDRLHMDYIDDTVSAYNDNPNHYVYTDWYIDTGNGFKRGGFPFTCESIKEKVIHPVTALLPRKWHYDIGGFDEELGYKGLEDWDYFLRIVLLENHHGYRVTKPLIYYDAAAGSRRNGAQENIDELTHIVKGRWDGMACRRCDSNKSLPVIAAPASIRTPQSSASAPVQIVQPQNNRRTASDRSAFGEGLAAQPAGRGRSRGVPVTPSATKSKESNMVGEIALVLVEENSGNIGKHSVVGAATRHKYGMYKHKDQIHMHPRDQHAQPQLYLIITPAKIIQSGRPSAPKVAYPSRRAAKLAAVETDNVETNRTALASARPAVDRMVAPSTTSLLADEFESVVNQINAAAVVEEEIEEEEVEEVEEVEVDIFGMSLREIKGLELDTDDATDAYFVELDGKNRSTVLKYFSSIIER